LFNESSLEMDDPYRPIDFSAISGYPHVIPKNALQKSCYQGSNVVNVRHHVYRVSHFFAKWCNNDPGGYWWPPTYSNLLLLTVF
jgi:hypothetical protein